MAIPSEKGAFWLKERLRRRKDTAFYLKLFDHPVTDVVEEIITSQKGIEEAIRTGAFPARLVEKDPRYLSFIMSINANGWDAQPHKNLFGVMQDEVFKELGLVGTDDYVEFGIRDRAQRALGRHSNTADSPTKTFVRFKRYKETA